MLSFLPGYFRFFRLFVALPLGLPSTGSNMISTFLDLSSRGMKLK